MNEERIGEIVKEAVHEVLGWSDMSQLLEIIGGMRYYAETKLPWALEDINHGDLEGAKKWLGDVITGLGKDTARALQIIKSLMD